MKPQKTLKSQSNLKKEEWNWRYNISWFQTVLQINSNQNSIVLKWQPTPVFLPGESQGRGSLVGCSPWGLQKSDTTELLHFHFSVSCGGEGNGNPLQCSCLENPRDWGVWWAAIYGVTQSQTRLQRLSSSSSSKVKYRGFPGGSGLPGRH